MTVFNVARMRACIKPPSIVLVALTVFSLAACSRNTDSNRLSVAAASDLAPPFEEIGRAFEQANSAKVAFNFGSSGMLAKQIENGSPVDVFVSANADYVDDLARNGFIIPGTRALYARGRITLWTNKESNIHIEQIGDLARAGVKRIAIANPEHAPYGIAARQALQNSGIWETVKPKIVFAENVRQTLQYAQTGNVDVAIVALSLSIHSDGRWILVPQELHQPIDQALGVIKGTKHELLAREFAAFLNGARGREIIQRYGFTVPGEGTQAPSK